MAIANRKRGRVEERFADVGQTQKRQKVGLESKEKLCCSEILEDLTNHHLGKLFQKLPVDSADLPDYLQQIWRPMDLGTVKSKLDKDLYSNCERFAADVRLIFSNATRYYPLGTCIFAAANRLSKFFEEKWKESREKLFASTKQGKSSSRVVHSAKDEDLSTLVHHAIQRSCASVSEKLSAAKALQIEALKVRFSNTIYSRANKKSLPQSQKREMKVMGKEKCVLFEDHLHDLKQLEMLCGWGSADASLKIQFGVPLKKLGFYLKGDDLEGEDEDAFLNGHWEEDDLEEGEIPS